MFAAAKPSRARERVAHSARIFGCAVVLILGSLLVVAVTLAGCASQLPAQPTPEPVEVAMATCIEAMDYIAEVNQPEVADVWAERNPGICAEMLDTEGEDEFIDSWLDPRVVRIFIADQTGGKG